MDPKRAKGLIELYQNLADQYRQAATEACDKHDPFRVYEFVKESIACDGKIRQIKSRYLNN